MFKFLGGEVKKDVYREAIFFNCYAAGILIIQAIMLLALPSWTLSLFRLKLLGTLQC